MGEIMKTIYKEKSRMNTRVEFQKDNQGLILCFKKQFTQDIIETATYKTEKAAIKWAMKVLK